MIPDPTYIPRIVAARHRLAIEDPEGEAEAVVPLVMTPAAWDAEYATPLPSEEAGAERRRLESARIGREAGYPEPEDRGTAALSDLGDVEYVEDLGIRPGRIVVVAAEEGSGKSYAITGELGIRVAAAGGSFAATWPVLTTGPVLVLSEMHADDDYGREATILESLNLERSALVGRYYRLPLMAAAGTVPALMSDEWLAWITGWLRDRRAVLLIVDTATGASRVDPWGRDIQTVYAKLRAVLADYPALCIALIVHLKKPQGTGQRRISDVLGEWGRWCDVILLLEHDGTRTKLSTRKRVRQERRIAATKSGGLLVDPIDLDEAKGTKVPTDAVLAAIVAQPGIGYAELGRVLEVSKATAARYVRALGTAVDAVPTGPKGATRLYPAGSPPHTASRTDDAVPEVVQTTMTTQGPPHHLTASIYEAVSDAVPEVVVTPSENRPPCYRDPDLFRAHASVRTVDGCPACEAAA
jgi:hypothetical protein